MADKLKLSFAQKSPEPAQSPRKVEKPPTPRIVAFKEVTPSKKPVAVASASTSSKSCSLMVTRLWRGKCNLKILSQILINCATSGLKKEDVMEYFGKFGKIISCSMTEAGNELVDGYKYLFLKFADVTSVDKALGKFSCLNFL